MKFMGEFDFLSNFFPAPITLGDGKVFPTSEHLYQAIKTTNPMEREAIRLAETPGKAKKMGQKVALTPFWESQKIIFMDSVLTLKFSQHPELIERLLRVEGPIVEDNAWQDTYWGVCGGEGRNELGKLLMALRERFRANLG